MASIATSDVDLPPLQLPPFMALHNPVLRNVLEKRINGLVEDTFKSNSDLELKNIFVFTKSVIRMPSSYIDTDKFLNTLFKICEYMVKIGFFQRGDFTQVTNPRITFLKVSERNIKEITFFNLGYSLEVKCESADKIEIEILEITDEQEKIQRELTRKKHVELDSSFNVEVDSSSDEDE